jgi:hypothetical protein
MEIATIPPRPKGATSDLVVDTNPDGHIEFISHIRTPIPKHLTRPNARLAPVPKTPQKNYTIKTTPNTSMGKGMFATRDIRAYDLVFAERPILITHNGIQPEIYSLGNKDFAENERRVEDYVRAFRVAYEAQLQGALDKMKKEDREVFMDLTHVPTSGEQWGPLVQRIQTNGFAIRGLDTMNGKLYSAIGKITSFMNHRFASSHMWPDQNDDE